MHGACAFGWIDRKERFTIWRDHGIYRAMELEDARSYHLPRILSTTFLPLSLTPYLDSASGSNTVLPFPESLILDAIVHHPASASLI